MSKNLIRQIDKYAIVSFDIFDTLLKRDVFSPRDVFDFVEKEYNSKTGQKIEYKNIRIQAEKAAREASEYAEITLDEIYDRIDLPERNELKKLELQIESGVLHYNPDLKEVYDYCVRTGKTIYIVSDMYLSETFLEEVLQREGFVGYKKLYVSSVYRKTKRSGELFKTFCEKEHISPKNVCHIGDSRYADYIGPRKCGIKSIHIKRLNKNTLYMDIPNNGALEQRTLFSFVNSHISMLQTRGERLGYEVLGPILDSFCKWIHDQYESRKTDHSRLWLAARDMYLFAEAYKYIYGDQTEFEYMYISRKSLRPVLTSLTGDITECGNTFARGKYTIRQIITKMGYTKEDVESCTDDELDEICDIRKLNESDVAKKILNSKGIIDKEDVLSKPGEKYLLSHGLFANDIVLADVGWHGTTQYILKKIQQSRSKNCNVFGLYLGSLDSTTDKLGNQYRSFVFDETRESLFSLGILVFEALILAQHGSTDRYEMDGEKAIPILGKADNVNAFLEAVQKGAMRFINEYNQSILCKHVQMDGALSSQAFCKMVTMPLKEELESIGDLDYEDAGYSKLAKPKNILHYIVRPSELLYELKHAPWRIGFLYNLLKVRLPYAKLYSLARKQQGKMT